MGFHIKLGVFSDDCEWLSGSLIHCLSISFAYSYGILLLHVAMSSCFKPTRTAVSYQLKEYGDDVDYELHYQEGNDQYFTTSSNLHILFNIGLLYEDGKHRSKTQVKSNIS